MSDTAVISDRRLEREAARRRQSRRGQAIAAVSTVVVLGGLAAWILTSPGWPAVRETFFNWEVFKESFPDVLSGFWLDVKLFVIVEIAVLIVGLLVALVRTSRAPALFPVRMLATVFVDLFRGIPTILLVYLIGFGIPALQLTGLPTDPVVLGGIALGLSYSAYVAEVYRAGIGSIHRGQRDAALAVGLTDAQAMRHVILPQAVRRVGAAAAQRLRRPAEGRRPGLDPRPAGGLPHRPDHPGRELQLHAADRRRAPLPGDHGAPGAGGRPHRRRPEGAVR